MARPAPVRRLLDRQGQVDLVVEGDAVVAGPGDLRFLLPGAVDRARPQLGEPEPAALVEPQRVDVVVGRGEPDFTAVEVPRGAGRGLDEQRPDADPALDRVERDDLQGVPDQLVGEKADDAAGPFGYESGQLSRAEYGAVDGDVLGPPEFRDEPGEHRAVALADRSDRDLRLVHPAIMRARSRPRPGCGAGRYYGRGDRGGYNARRWATAGHDRSTSSRPAYDGVHLRHPGLRHLPPPREGGAASRGGGPAAGRPVHGRPGQDRGRGPAQRRRPDGGGHA